MCVCVCVCICAYVCARVCAHMHDQFTPDWVRVWSVASFLNTGMHTTHRPGMIKLLHMCRLDVHARLWQTLLAQKQHKRGIF